MVEGEDVKIEACDSHDGVVCVFLVLDGKFGEAVEDEGEIVVGRTYRLEEGGTSAEERDILDVGVVMGIIGDEVMDVVTALPPADGKAAAEVSDEDANEGIGGEILGNATMTGVVGGEHYLMPEETKEEGGGFVPAMVEGGDEEGEQRQVPTDLLEIFSVVAFVEAFILDPFMECFVSDINVMLCLEIERWEAS